MSTNKSIKVEDVPIKGEEKSFTAEDHSKASAKVEDKLTSYNNERTRNTSEKARRYKVILLFQQSEVGPIIGKNGSTIKSIKEKTDCALNFYNEYQRNRSLVILGNKEKIPEVIKLVAEALLNQFTAEEKKVRVSLFWSLHRSSAFSLIGKGGVNSKRLKSESNAVVSVLLDKETFGSEVLVRLSGTPDELSKAFEISINEFIREPSNGVFVRSFENSSQRNRSSMLMSRPRGYRMMNSKRGGSQHFKIESTQTIKLRRELAGVIIGKKGRNVRKIREYSGARIRIETPEDDDSMATVFVVGRPTCVALAFECMESTIDNYMKQFNTLKERNEKNNGSTRTQAKMNVKSENMNFPIGEDSKENIQITT